MALIYTHRPKPYSNALELTLEDGVLKAERGNSNLRFPLRAIEQITLRFAPKNTVRHAFTCKIRMQDGRSLQFGNVSWKTLIENERHDADYRRMVTTLAGAAETASPHLILHAGITTPGYWAMLAFGVAMAAGLAGIGMLALARGQWPFAVLALGLAAYLVHWQYEYLRRNRPRDFSAPAIPPDILP